MSAEQITLKLANDAPGIGRAGQLVTLALTPADVHDPTELPTYLAGYKPAGYRADEVSEPVLVDKDSDKYRTFDSEDTFRMVNVKGSIQGAVPEVDPKSALTTYKVVDRFIGSFIPEVTEQNAAPNYRIRQRAMRRCRRALDLDREYDVWTTLATLGSWNAANRTTLGATYKWNGGSVSDPIVDLQTRIIASLQPVTDIWFNHQVSFDFINHAKVRDHLRTMLGDNGANSILQGVVNADRALTDFMIPGLGRFHVVAGKYLNESASTHDYILGSDVVLTVSPPGGVPQDGEEIATSITFRRRGNAGVGFETREYRIENRGPRGGTMVVVSQADVMKITGSTCGGLIKSAHQ